MQIFQRNEGSDGVVEILGIGGNRQTPQVGRRRFITRVGAGLAVGAFSVAAIGTQSAQAGGYHRQHCARDNTYEKMLRCNCFSPDYICTYVIYCQECMVGCTSWDEIVGCC